MTVIETLGLVLAFIGLAFAFEAPRKWFLRTVRLGNTASQATAPSERDKLVNSAWWEASDLRKEYQNRGFSRFHWSNAQSVAEREQQEHEVVYLNDASTNTRFRLVNRSGQILMARRNP